MIRINLLDHLPPPTERLQAMLNPGRSGGFISRRETMLGGLFLVLAFSILGTQLWLNMEPEVEPEPEQMSSVPSLSPPKTAAAPTPPSQEPKSPPVGETPRNPPPDPAPIEATIATTSPAPAKKVAPRQATAEPTTPAQPAPEPLEGGGGLTAVRVTPLEDGVDIFLPINGQPKIRSFRVDDPKRVVFDIPGAVLEAPRDQQVQRVESEWVSRVRTAQNQIDPPLVRVVIEVPEFPSVTSFVSDAGVAIRVRRP